MLSDVCSDTVATLREVRERLRVAIEDSVEQGYSSDQIVQAVRADADLQRVIAMLDSVRQELDKPPTPD